MSKVFVINWFDDPKNPEVFETKSAAKVHIIETLVCGGVYKRDMYDMNQMYDDIISLINNDCINDYCEIVESELFKEEI